MAEQVRGKMLVNGIVSLQRQHLSLRCFNSGEPRQREIQIPIPRCAADMEVFQKPAHGEALLQERVEYDAEGQREQEIAVWLSAREAQCRSERDCATQARPENDALPIAGQATVEPDQQQIHRPDHHDPRDDHRNDGHRQRLPDSGPEAGSGNLSDRVKR